MPKNPPPATPILTEVPWSEGITDYDRTHLTIYLRILDALAEKANRDEMARLILGIEPTKEPDRARAAVDSHVTRARWMAEHGKLLTAQAAPPRKS